MFKKPIKVKTQNILKGSERKKLRELLVQTFPNAKEDDLWEIVPLKGEDVFVSKIADSRMIVYLLGQEPILFDPDNTNDIYPTSYTLCRIPQILPTLTIYPPVLNFILKGANLMLPGVVGNNIGVCKVGEKRSVILIGTPFPIAVGTMAISSKTGALKEKKGIALNIIHHFRDTLSQMGTKIDIVIPEIVANESDLDKNLAIEFSEGVDINTAENPTTSSTTATQITDNTDTTSEITDMTDILEISDISSITTTTTHDNNISGPSSSSSTTPSDTTKSLLSPSSSTTSNDTNKTPLSMDELLLASFLQAIRSKLKDKKLPILINVFYATMMIPCRPLGTELDIKKSLYKKLSVFLNAMRILGSEGEFPGLIDLVEDQPGMIYITKVHRNNLVYRRFQPHVSVQDEEEREAEKSKPKGDGKIKVRELFGLPRSLQKLTEIKSDLSYIEGPKKERLFMISDITALLLTYVKTNGLDQPLIREESFPALGSTTPHTTISPQQQTPSKPLSTVRIDSFISKNILKRDEGTKVFKEELLSNLKEKLQPYYQIMRESGDIDIRKGNIQIIKITSKKVSNKWVTSITNLAGLCSVDFSDITKDLQHKFACAVSTAEDVTGICDKILVHGNFVKEVSDYLVKKFGIPQKYIEVNLPITRKPEKNTS